MKIVKQKVEVLCWPERPATDIEMAARTCYQSVRSAEDNPKRTNDFIRRLINNGHEAMLEHVSATFRFITSRAIANEIVRHRMASYAQESTRYVDYKYDIEFVLPSGLNDEQLSCFWAKCMDAETQYKRLRGMGLAPQIARDILPLCLKTELVMTANFREWRHFLKLRTAPDAHPMMRELAGMVMDVFRAIAPVFVEDIQGGVADNGNVINCNDNGEKLERRGTPEITE